MSLLLRGQPGLHFATEIDVQFNAVADVFYKFQGVGQVDSDVFLACFLLLALVNLIQQTANMTRGPSNVVLSLPLNTQ